MSSPYEGTCAGCALWDRSVTPAVCGSIGNPLFNVPTDFRQRMRCMIDMDTPHNVGPKAQQLSMVRLTLRALAKMARAHELTEWMADIPGAGNPQSVLTANDVQEMADAMENAR